MSLLEPHIVHNRASWEKALFLTYRDVSQWLEDVCMLRARLGWPVVVHKMASELSLAVTAEDPSGERYVRLVVGQRALRLGSRSHNNLAKQVLYAFDSPGGEEALTEAFRHVPLNESFDHQSVYDCILSEDFL